MVCRYFGISYCRTGTTSLYYAMLRLGFKASHYNSLKGFEYVKNHVDFVNDLPIPLLYKQLDRRFSDSKFIFPDRHVNDWLKSMDLHWKRTSHLTMGDWQKMNKSFFGTLIFDKIIWGERFLAHRKDVLDYFKDRPDDLLVLDMPYTKQGFIDLCKFVNRNPRKYFDKMKMPHKCGSYSDSNYWCPRDEVKSYEMS